MNFLTLTHARKPRVDVEGGLCLGITLSMKVVKRYRKIAESQP